MSLQPGTDEATTPESPDASGARASGLNSFHLVLAVLAMATTGLVAVLSGTLSDGSSDTAAGYANIPFTTVDGVTGTLADYQGEPMVVNFFASWCPPCRAELPDFEAVSQDNPAVTFVGVSHDLDETSWRSLVAEVDISYDTVYQPGTEIWTELGGRAMPTTVFISADGEVLESHAGLLTAERLQQLIDELLL
jgi:thiol-disulfide isomerase/thioredoxin